MKLTLMQRFFAGDWPARIWFTALPLFFAAGIVCMCQPSWALLTNWKSLLGLLAVVVISLLLGLLASVLVGWPILGSLYYGRGIKNGGPFHEGDQVLILTGPHKGRIVKVYAQWQGNTVRVELGDLVKETCKDIFSPTQLLRANATPPEKPRSGVSN
jgi:hypothetical protein